MVPQEATYLPTCIKHDLSSFCSHSTRKEQRVQHTAEAKLRVMLPMFKVDCCC
jgi:hypothetical protein